MLSVGEMKCDSHQTLPIPKNQVQVKPLRIVSGHCLKVAEQSLPHVPSLAQPRIEPKHLWKKSNNNLFGMLISVSMEILALKLNLETGSNASSLSEVFRTNSFPSLISARRKGIESIFEDLFPIIGSARTTFEKGPGKKKYCA
jgi:hypothetical protein